MYCFFVSTFTTAPTNHVIYPVRVKLFPTNDKIWNTDTCVTATLFHCIVRPKPSHLEDIYIKLKSLMKKLSISETLWTLDFYAEA